MENWEGKDGKKHDQITKLIDDIKSIQIQEDF